MKRMRSSDSHASTKKLGRVAATTLTATFLLGILLLPISTIVPFANAATPAPPPTYDLPKVRYTLTWLQGGTGWANLFPRTMNNWGDVAGGATDSTPTYSGFSTAFAYNATTQTTLNLNLLNIPWLDLNAGSQNSALQSPGTWFAMDSYEINDAGDIVGIAGNVLDANLIRAFILQNAFNDPLSTHPRRFLLLPEIAPVNSYGTGINNHGEVAVVAYGQWLARYMPRGDGSWPLYDSWLQTAVPSNISDGGRINDDGTIICVQTGRTPTSFRQTFSQALAGTSPDLFPGYRLWGISNWGISGSRVASGNLKGGIIRLPVTTNVVELVSSKGIYSRDINDQGVLVFESNGRGFVSYDVINPTTGKKYGLNGDGVLPLDKLVENQDAVWLNSSEIRVASINDMGPSVGHSGLGQIAGVARYPNRCFLLIPKIIP